MNRLHFGKTSLWAAIFSLMLISATRAPAMTNEECLVCHEDQTLTTSTGKSAAVSPAAFASSVHKELSCSDCHSQPANYDDAPHFKNYEKVNCASCHDAAGKSFVGSFHGKALATGSAKAPDCAACHAAGGNPHQIEPLNLRTAENACRRCHDGETGRYDGSVHAVAAKAGKPSPGCVSCHATHSAALPPSTGAVNKLCESCHSGAMKQVETGAHREAIASGGVMSCSSCHDVHATHKPHLDQGVISACNECHAGYRDQFVGTVHQPLLEQGKMNCLSCHRTHQVTDAGEKESFGCGACHTEVEATYRTSVHRMARLHGNRTAATCADCHTGHHVKAINDTASLVYRDRIPQTCGKCHGNTSVVTSDFVRLPISLPSYTASVHGKPDEKGSPPAVCTDCHGTHNLQGASEPTSSIAKVNLATTCGTCHQVASEEYVSSIHGRAVALGIKDSPSCTDCHDEHLILNIKDPDATTNPSHLAQQTCGKCHSDPAMAARYGLPTEVIESYEDSYHGWAIKRGGKAVAVCVDCHMIHNIRTAMDPASSINKANVVNTCGRCHENSNAQFAASYSHILARGKLMVHDYIKIIYIWLIALVLGGMFLHNLLIYIHAMKEARRKHMGEAAVVRMTVSEIWQHIILAVSFIGLGVTGFALRFPESWWAKLLVAAGLTEDLRKLTHRGLAAALVLASIYHVFYVLFTKRGRMLIWALIPKFTDIGEVIGNLFYYAGFKKHPPRFGMYDYTAKAEYWALIWGTVVMGVTGMVLWFPAIATSWAPGWLVRVCETIHFWEAILAVSAIVIWHFFFVIFLPKEYPMSWTWITGRMSKHEWNEMHPRAAEETGVEPEEVKVESKATMDSPKY